MGFALLDVDGRRPLITKVESFGRHALWRGADARVTLGKTQPHMAPGAESRVRCTSCLVPPEAWWRRFPLKAFSWLLVPRPPEAVLLSSRVFARPKGLDRTLLTCLLGLILRA